MVNPFDNKVVHYFVRSEQEVLKIPEDKEDFNWPKEYPVWLLFCSNGTVVELNMDDIELLQRSA